MKILITGAFGNIGLPVLEEALKRGHEVTVLELDTKRTRQRARRFRHKLAGLYYGDVRDELDAAVAMKGAEAVIHLSGIIPPLSENNPDLCRQVNVEGTQNLISAAEALPQEPVFILASSVAVMGPTQEKAPPLKVTDPVNPINHYGRSKADAEELLKKSSLEKYSITRFGGVMPTKSRYKMDMVQAALSIPYDSRFEFILDTDLAMALINGSERLSSGVISGGRTYFLGGGEGCQVVYHDFLGTLFKVMGIPLPDSRCFSKDMSFVDWLDTEQAQKDLVFQKADMAAYTEIYRSQVKHLLPFTKLFGGLITKSIERKSVKIKRTFKAVPVSPRA